MSLLCPKCEKTNKCDCKSCNPDGKATDLVIILEQEQLHEDCLYGGMRLNVEKISQLHDKRKIMVNSTNWVFNDILYNAKLPNPYSKHETCPGILGCFQLHKKKSLQISCNNAGHGDFLFGLSFDCIG